MLKSFGMKDIKGTVTAYPCDQDMTKNKQDPLSTGQRNINRVKKEN